MKCFSGVFGTPQWMLLAPDGAAGASASEEDDAELDAPTEPSIEYVDEGSDEADGVVNTEEKSREDIMAELAEAREKLNALEAGAKPVDALSSTMERFLSANAPAKPARKDGASAGIGVASGRISDADFEKRYNQLMLENPLQAQKEYSERMLDPVLQTFAVNQAQVSRELLLANPDSKKIYDKYGDEIEEAVAAIPVYERLKNPKVYQTALSHVKAVHSDELSQETIKAQIDAGIAEALKAYGIDPTKQKPVAKQAGYNAPQSVLGRPAQSTDPNVRRVVVPAWVAEEARIKGLDKAFLYEKYRKAGKVK